MDIVDVILAVGETTKTTEKVAALKAGATPQLKEFLRKTYDSFFLTNISAGSMKGIRGVGPSTELKAEYLDAVRNTQGRNAKLTLIQKYASQLNDTAFNILKCALDKDLGVGISSKLINKAFPGLVPEFELMLAHKQTRKDFDSNFEGLEYVFANIKIDGIRCVCFIHDMERIEFFTRDGKPIDDMLVENIRNDIKKIAHRLIGKMLDGELYSNRFQELMRVVNRKKFDGATIEIRNSCKYGVFDIINISDFLSGDSGSLIYRIDELEALDETNFIKKVPYVKVAANYELLFKMSRYFITKGNEGIIVKHPLSTYEKKRSKMWLKFKDKNTEDLKIVDVFEGEGQFVGMLGGIILDLGNGKTVRCGSGFTHADRQNYWASKEELIGKTAEVSFMERTEDASLRHPVFERFREDK